MSATLTTTRPATTAPVMTLAVADLLEMAGQIIDAAAPEVVALAGEGIPEAQQTDELRAVEVAALVCELIATEYGLD